MTLRPVLALLTLAFLPALARAQDAPPQMPLPAPVQSGVVSDRRSIAAFTLGAEERVVLDGMLDEPVWQRAAPATDFRQQDPENGQPATEPTEVRIVYDRDTLYMGVICFDSEPDRWLGFQRGRDGGLGSDDRFQWTIDTFLDGRTGYFFEMNPSGLMADALQGAANASNRQWDGIWNARVRRSEIGWTLEIAIPFRTLNFNPDADAWGINFQRTVRRKNEESLWMGWARNQGLRRMSNAGRLTGITGVTQGHGLDVKPYLVGTSQSTPGRANTATQNDAGAGLDLFYNVTPGLRANVTVNTDFAQAEVDQRQTNLTRFSLFFPEKRDFFLDGALFFNFADSANGNGNGGVDLTPFFSRRIGLNERGEPQPINFGGKLTGQAGPFDLGMLQVQTREDGAAYGEDFTVLRARRRLLGQSSIGAIYTRRAARGVAIDDRHTAGVDFLFSTSSFLGSDNLDFGGFFLKSPNPRQPGRDTAIGLQLDYPNDPFSAQMEFREVQKNYDAAIGFTRRVGFREYDPRVSFSPRPRQHPWIRNFNFEGELDLFVDPISNQTQTREIDVTVVEVETHSQDSFKLGMTPTFERLDEDFEIAPGITLPVGAGYSFTRYSVEAQTAGRRLIAVSPQVEWGGFYSGDRLRTSLQVNVRARPGVMFTLANEWNRVDLAEGRFYTRLYRGVSELQFTPFVSWVNNVQFDTQSAVLGMQSRFRWIVRPGSDLYFVYIHNWADDPLRNRFASLDRRASSKLSYTHRF